MCTVWCQPIPSRRVRFDCSEGAGGIRSCFSIVTQVMGLSCYSNRIQDSMKEQAPSALGVTLESGTDCNKRGVFVMGDWNFCLTNSSFDVIYLLDVSNDIIRDYVYF